MVDPMHFMLKLQCSPLQYSDPDKQRADDLPKVFGRGSHMIGGTEADRSEPLLQKQLITSGERDDYNVFSHPFGEWAAVSKSFGTVVRHDWLEVLAGDSSHMPRGVFWIKVKPKIDIGPIYLGVGHWLRESRGDVTSNKMMTKSFIDFVDRKDEGKAVVFICGDTNAKESPKDSNQAPTHKQLDAAGLVSCWDDVNKYPKTHPAGTIDIIARNQRDSRVSPAIDAKTITHGLHKDHGDSLAWYKIKRLDFS